MNLYEQMQTLLQDKQPEPEPEQVKISPSSGEGPEVDLLDALALLTKVSEVFTALSRADLDMPVELYEQVIDVAEDVSDYLDAWDFREEDK